MMNVVLSTTNTETLIEEVANRVFEKITDFLGSCKDQGSRDLINRKEAKELLGISDPTLWRWEKEGKIQGYAIGGKRFYKRSELINSIRTSNKSA